LNALLWHLGDARETGGRIIPEVAPQQQLRAGETGFKASELSAQLEYLGDARETGGRIIPEVAPQQQLRV
jgi:hypothetical protein